MAENLPANINKQDKLNAFQRWRLNHFKKRIEQGKEIQWEKLPSYVKEDHEFFKYAFQKDVSIPRKEMEQMWQSSGFSEVALELIRETNDEEKIYSLISKDNNFESLINSPAMIRALLLKESQNIQRTAHTIAAESIERNPNSLKKIFDKGAFVGESNDLFKGEASWRNHLINICEDPRLQSFFEQERGLQEWTKTELNPKRNDDQRKENKVERNNNEIEM